MSTREKRSLISPDHTLPIDRQCSLLGLNRSSYYYKTQEADETDLMNQISEVWQRQPARGYRRVADALFDDYGRVVNHKRVARLMQLMGVRSLLPQPRTSIPNRSESPRPYLLKDIDIGHANQVWATDITYIKLPGGMVYLFAIIDWHTRYVVSWKLATTMEACHAVEILEQAVDRYGKPLIVNADQGSQFTGEAWIHALESRGIQVSHDGVGRCIDNIRVERLWWTIKYEHVHLYFHQTVVDLERGLAGFLHFYNTERRHSSLEKKRPADVYWATQTNGNSNELLVDQGAHCRPLNPARIFDEQKCQA